MGSSRNKKSNRPSSPSYRDKTSKNKSELKEKYSKKYDISDTKHKSYDNDKERDRSPSIPKHSKKKKYSNDPEVKLLKKLEDEREKMKADHKKKKELMKALEMPEEKRLRRLNKKESKERKRKEKMGWDNEYLHFTNADNPYGDNNLLDTFVWKKKLEKEGLCSLSKEEIQQQSRVKMEENRVELEKVKKRRQERELEREERDKLMEMQTRQREAAQFSHFSSQEDIFQLEQARMRSQIRITDGRAKPIDLLAQYATAERHMTAADVTEPHAHLTGLTLADLEDLLEDIKVYQQLEKKDSNQSYWNDLTTIVVDEVRRLRQRDPVASSSASAETGSARHGIHASIASDVSKIFQNKSVKELHQLRASIERKLAGPTAGLDVGYWESLLSQLKAHQARARLRERHRDNLRKKLQMLKAEQGVKEEPQSAEESESSDSSSDEDEDEKEQDDRKKSASDSEEQDESAMIVSASVSAYTSGRFSPKLLSPSKLEPGTVCVDPQEDEQRLAWKRSRIVGAKGQAAADTLTPEEKAMHQQMQNTISSDDAQFSVEVRLDPQQHLWADKYRPRKPRYFNRVHTGFEWNKYNQTHYDMDNPPPKIVQGYKFNIFYPDLIDRKKPPQYDLIPCDENRDFALLRFSSGPPYEDIAFKIVNREWEYSYKRGFRCQFHNNIFQLWFHFKRYRYRR